MFEKQKSKNVKAELFDSIALFNSRSEKQSFKDADWIKIVKIVNCGNRKSIWLVGYSSEPTFHYGL